MRIPLKHKFNAVAVERDGFKFKSKMQRQRYDDLKLAQTAGDVVMFLQEVPFRMPGTVYWADFVVFWADGNVTPTFKTKRRMMAIHYPAVDIICITYKRRKNTCA